MNIDPMMSRRVVKKHKPVVPQVLPRLEIKKQRRSVNWKVILLYGVAIVGLVLAQNILLGRLLIAAYVIWVVYKKVYSRQIFKLAVIILAVSPLFLLRDPEVGQYFAEYVFLILIIAVVRLATELRSENIKDVVT